MRPLTSFGILAILLVHLAHPPAERMLPPPAGLGQQRAIPVETAVVVVVGEKRAAALEKEPTTRSR